MVKLLEDEKAFAIRAADEKLQWEYCERCGRKMVHDFSLSHYHRTDGRKIYEVRKRCPRYGWIREYENCFLSIFSLFFRGYAIDSHSVTEWLVVDPARKEET